MPRRHTNVDQPRPQWDAVTYLEADLHQLWAKWVARGLRDRETQRTRENVAEIRRRYSQIDHSI